MSVLARLLARGEERPVFVAVSVVALLLVLQWPFVDWYLRATEILEPIRFYDFGVYMGAVDSWHAGEPIYRRNEAGGYFGTFLYPPPVLLLLDLFDGLPFHVAGWAWESFSLALLWIGLQAAIAAYGLSLRWWERGVLLWALFGFQPLLFSFKHGQSAIFLGGVLAFALAGLAYGERRGPEGDGSASGWSSRVASGALTSVAAVVKLTYLTAGAHLLRDRDRLAGAIAAGGVLAGVSLLVFGVDTHLRYLDVLRWGIGSGSTPKPPQLATIAYYDPLYAVRDAATAVRVLGVVAVAGLALAAEGDADTATFALGVAAVPLLAPQRYTYTFAALLPAFVALLAVELRRDDGRPAVPVVALVLLHVHALTLKLLVGPLRARFEIVAALQPVAGLLQPGLWGNLLLVGLAAVRVGEHASIPMWLSRRIPHPR